jgi:di/tricarboxylate transporter
MTPTATLVVVLFAFLALLVSQAVRIEVVALATIAALALTGLLSPADAFSGLSSTATVTVAAMLVLSAGVERSGVMDALATRFARLGEQGERRLLLALLAPIALLSAFLNNTPVVALMVPVVLAVSRKTGVQPSRLLIPVSYVSILGGTCTLIGTSTNILVDSLYRESGGPGFGMFEFSGLGMVYLLVGGAYVVLLVPRLLPHRTALAEVMHATQPGQFVTEVSVPADSGLVGRRLAQVFGEAKDIRVLEIVRDEEAALGPDPDTVLRAGDLLLVEGTARTIHEMIDQRRVAYGTAVSDDERVPISRIDLRMVEAVIAPNSRFLHRKVRDLGLSRRLGIQVLLAAAPARPTQGLSTRSRLRPAAP